MDSPSTIPQPIACCLANRGQDRYLLEVQSTTGYVAWQTAEGARLVSQAEQVSIARSRLVRFWPCAGFKDTSYAGQIISVDCHGNSLIMLDVSALTDLQYLDCSYNRLDDLDLCNNRQLQAINAEHNRLEELAVKHLSGLRLLNCSQNRLRELDLEGLKSLEVLDVQGNPLHRLGRSTVGKLKTIRGASSSLLQ